MNDPRPAGAPRLLPVLLAELKRRGVLRAASVYMVGAWVAMQAADIVFGAFNLSQRWVALVIILALAGFPLVVLLSWVYRLGVDVEAAAPGPELAASRLHAGLALATFAGVAVLAAIGLLVLGREQPGPAGGGAAAEASLDRIAVLYFADRTRDTSLSYLAPALTEALIDQLDAVEGLSVISRNGVAPYRERTVAPDSIGRALGVGVLVSGEVRRAAGQVSVAAELSDARTATVLRSVHLRRPAADPIALVDAVVVEVADSLLAQLGREQDRRRWRAGTKNAEAWRLLQQAGESAERSRELRSRGDGAAALAELALADSLLVRAEQLDRDYHDATVQRATIAHLRALMLFRGGGRAAVARALTDGEAHATRVLARAPLHAGALEARGILREFRYASAPPADSTDAAALLAAAESDLRAAVRADPRRARALHALSSVLDARGEFVEALVYLEEAYRVDAYQQSAADIVDRLFTLNFELGRDPEAERWCAELLRRTGTSLRSAACQLQLDAWAASRTPDPTRARALVAEALAAGAAGDATAHRPHLEMLLASVLARAGLPDSARAVLENASSGTDPELLQLEAGVRAQLGEYDSATSLLREYGRQRRTALVASSRRFAALPLNPLLPERSGR